MATRPRWMLASGPRRRVPRWLRVTAWTLGSIVVGLWIVGGLLLSWIKHEPCPSEESAWPSPITVTDPAAAILQRLSDWRRASDVERHRAAQAVAAATAEFQLLGVRRFECLDQSFDVAVFLNPKTTLEFSLIPGGTFEMGAPEGHALATDRDTPAHPVTLTQRFLIGRTAVTRLAWNQIATAASLPQYDGDPGEPASGMSWSDATAWCVASGLQLPSEAEWEYAARAGHPGPYYFKNRSDVFLFTGEREPRDIGAKPSGTTATGSAARGIPNAFGLHDTFGLHAEWVRDGYASYDSEPAVDPDTSIRGLRMYRGSPPVTYWGSHGTSSGGKQPVWRRNSPDWNSIWFSMPGGLRALRRVRIQTTSAASPR